MALGIAEKERIDKLDFTKGGGFSDFFTDKKKLAPADSKFLFIGLGGKGSRTVASLKTGVYQKIQCNSKTDRPDNFEYLVIDTDQDNLDNLSRSAFGEVGLSSDPVDSETCQLYDCTSAERLSPSRHNLIPEYIAEWLSPTMNQELQGNGAGGIRQAGRYLLFGDTAFNGVKKNLERKLGKLHAQITNPNVQKLIVYIFAGVGGGTGSGTIIDIPYIIRKICGENKWNVSIYGYIFLPDTYPAEAFEQTHVKYNSYAAMKEIDTLMNIGNMHGTARFKARYTANFEVDSTERIFDSCVLVSGKRSSSGGGMVSEPDQFSRRVVVDNIINLVTQNMITEGFLANSFLDNSKVNVSDKVNTIRRDNSSIPENAYYQYTIIGTGALVLPIEQILAYMAHHSMKKIRSAWDRKAQQGDVEKLLNEVKMKPEDIAGAILNSSKVPLLQYTEGIGGKADKEQVINGTLYNVIKGSWMTNNVDLHNAWIESMNNYLANVIIKTLEENYENILQDGEKGIFYLKEILFSRVKEGQDINGVVERVTEDYMKSLSDFLAAQEENERRIDEEMEQIQEKLNGMFGFLKSSLIEDYRKLCVEKLVTLNLMELYGGEGGLQWEPGGGKARKGIVKDCLEQVQDFLDLKREELLAYIDVFNYMKDVVDRNYNSVKKGIIPRAEYAGTMIDFSKKDDRSTQKITGFLDSLLKKNTAEQLAGMFGQCILSTKNQWRYNEETFNPMSVFVNFLENQYKEIPELTIEKFLKLKYGNDGLSKGMKEVCNELKNRAGVIFPADNLIDLSSLASRKYVVIPTGAININDSMSEFAKIEGASVAKSDDMNSVYWYNLIIGVPLFLLSDIGEYERKYEHNSIAGMHCWESPVGDWKEWPALANPIPEWNRREKEYVKRVKKSVEEYLACGLICKGDVDGKFYAYCMPKGNSDINRESILKWMKETYLKDPAMDEEGSMADGTELIDAMRSAHGFYKYPIEIPTVYMTVTEKSLYKLVRMNVYLYHMLQDTYAVYTECRKIIDDENKKYHETKVRMKNLQRFYDYIRTGIIQFTEDAILLEHKDGEQEEIMYFDDYNGLDNDYYIFIAFHRFVEIFKEERLEEIDIYKEELAGNHSEEAREKYRELSDSFIEECTKIRESLKKLDTKKKLEKAGQGDKIVVYTDFFDTLIGMRKGKSR